MSEKEQIVNQYGAMQIEDMMKREENPIAKEQWAAQVEGAITSAKDLRGRIIGNKGYPLYLRKQSLNPYVNFDIKIDEHHIYNRYRVASERYDDLREAGHTTLAVEALRKSGNIF